MVIAWIRQKIGGQAIFDSLSWVLAVFLAGLFRYEFDGSKIDGAGFLALGVTMAMVAFAVGKILSLYRARHRTGSFDELFVLILATASTFVPFVVLIFFFGATWGIPRSILFIATPLFLLLSGAARTMRRFLLATGQRPAAGRPVLIYGAGLMADKLIPQLLEDPQSLFLPVGLLDDHPRQSNRWISGVKMLGTFSNLAAIVRKTGATGLVVAIPRASAKLLKEIRDVATPLGLGIFILPNFSEILNSSGDRVVLRDLGIEDLVGRRSIKIDSPKIDSLIRDKRVLITGAGGSIGVELCKQVARFNPRELIFLDRDETGLQQAQLATQNSGLLDSPNVVLADIRDFEALEAVWKHHKPEIVFHAAALKHLPMLESFPDEAWKTNVKGTLNVLNASLRFGVMTFVNISTDKAADPSSVLGRSKLLSEQLTEWASDQGEGNYLSVRFGNVLGSRGSLVPTLAYLLDNNLPVTITHPDATRYFMTIPEACQLVMQAGTERSASSIFILDMGEPVKILDVARRMIELSGKDIDIVYTGLRKGEKLHESLHMYGEDLVTSSHELIWTAKSAITKPENLPQIHKGWAEA